jgi:hypothetical protein
MRGAASGGTFEVRDAAGGGAGAGRTVRGGVDEALQQLVPAAASRGRG